VRKVHTLSVRESVDNKKSNVLLLHNPNYTFYITILFFFLLFLSHALLIHLLSFLVYVVNMSLPKPEELGQLPEIEQQWAVRAMHHAETYMKLLQAVDGANLRLTKYALQM
jgi:hypothetical protein